MSRLKIAAISYLNTAPLLWDFDRSPSSSDFEMSYTLPADCAEALRSGTADIGIVPVASYATIPDLLVVPDVAIAARRAVRSILLVSDASESNVSKEHYLAGMRSIALDTSSMTSAALTKILFAKWLGGPRHYKPMAPNLDVMLAECDAALLIGDPALQVDRSRYFTLDLAEEWNACTGKPAVFAFWAIRKQALSGRDRVTITNTFKGSRDRGLLPKNLELIAEDWADRLSIPINDVQTYLTCNIHYYLDSPCLEGLHLFYRYAAEVGALPRAPELEFL